MQSDREIAKKIWDGKIAIQFNLDPSEIVSQLEPPLPYYLLAPRGSYIRLITEGVKRYFQEYAHEVTDINDEMWFSYNGKPLKWHYPIGVLFDILSYDTPLPWSITVHFSCFPADEVLSCKSGYVEKTVESHLLNTLKQSDSIKFGTAKKVQGLMKKDHLALWNGFKKQAYEESYDQYWEVNKRIVTREEGENIKNIPFRIYDGDKPVFTKPASPLALDGNQITLGEFMMQVYPSIFSSNDKDNTQENNSDNANGAGNKDENWKLQKNIKIIIQGVQPSLATPMLWLCDTCSHPDNFLHIVIHRSSGKSKTKSNNEISTNNNSNNNKSSSETKKKIPP